VFKGLGALPAYLAFWGVLLATKRLLKAFVMPGLGVVRTELLNFQELQRQVLKPSRIPDYILSAPDYTSSSAGIGCLYRVCKDLRNLGFEACITGSQVGHPGYPVPILSRSEAIHAAKSGAWVIYPETVSGNPLHGKNVIRWVLNRPGLLGGEEVYSENEHVFVYSEVFAPYVKNKIRGRLYVPTMDQNIFFPPENEQPRSLECYYVGKSEFKDGYFDPSLTIEITRSTPPKSELGKIFRAAKILYCFDNSTALAYEAIICGCPVMIIPDGTQTWDDYQKLELGIKGMGWGKAPENSAAAIHSRELRQRLAVLESEYAHQLEDLVTYTQNIYSHEDSQNLRSAEKKATDRKDLDLPVTAK
jgi:hypothetical protein